MHAGNAITLYANVYYYRATHLAYASVVLGVVILSVCHIRAF